MRMRFMFRPKPNTPQPPEEGVGKSTIHENRNNLLVINQNNSPFRGLLSSYE